MLFPNANIFVVKWLFKKRLQFALGDKSKALLPEMVTIYTSGDHLNTCNSNTAGHYFSLHFKNCLSNFILD